MKRTFSLIFFLLFALTVEADNTYHGSFTGTHVGIGAGITNFGYWNGSQWKSFDIEIGNEPGTPFALFFDPTGGPGGTNGSMTGSQYSLSGGILQGNASGLTNLNPANLTAGGIVPPDAVYTLDESTNPNFGFGVGYPITLTNGVTYLATVDDGGNGGGLFDTNGAQFGAATGQFTATSNGPAIFFSVSASLDDPMQQQLKVVNTTPVIFAGDTYLSHLLAGNVFVSGAFDLSAPLSPANGGTGQTSISGLASQVGTFFAGTRSADPWNIFETNVAAYAGQIITAEPFGAGQQMFLTIAQSTAAGDNTNSIDIYPGFELIGTPTRMPQLSQVSHMYLGGYLNNTNPVNDAEFNLLSINPNASGVFVTFGSYGTNISLGQQTWPGSGFSSITNTLGQKVYLHDKHAMGIGMVPDPSTPGDCPNTGIWVMNGTAGNSSFPDWAICNAAVPLGSGNYSWLRNSCGNCVVGFPIWVTDVFSPYTNGWIWGTVFNMTNGNVNIASNLFVNTLTITNVTTSGGFNSVATNTYSVTTGGFTNTGTKEIIARGFTGTSVTFSNKVSHVNFSYGTISTARDIVLLVGESLTGSSCAAAGITDH